MKNIADFDDFVVSKPSGVYLYYKLYGEQKDEICTDDNPSRRFTRVYEYSSWSGNDEDFVFANRTLIIKGLLISRDAREPNRICMKFKDKYPKNSF